MTTIVCAIPIIYAGMVVAVVAGMILTVCIWGDWS